MYWFLLWVLCEINQRIAIYCLPNPHIYFVTYEVCPEKVTSNGISNLNNPHTIYLKSRSSLRSLKIYVTDKTVDVGTSQNVIANPKATKWGRKEGVYEIEECTCDTSRYTMYANGMYFQQQASDDELYHCDVSKFSSECMIQKTREMVLRNEFFCIPSSAGVDGLLCICHD